MGPSKVAACGVARWAHISLNNSERDASKVILKQGSRLKVPISTLRIHDREISWICPRDWLQFICDHGLWHRLCGLQYEESHLCAEMWRSFWDRFEKLQPDFQVFDDPDFDRENTAAFYVHGDEGRTLKKSGIMITSLQSCLGYGTDAKRLKRDHSGHLKPLINYQGNTYATRFVSSILPKRLYEDDPEFFHAVMAKTAGSLKSLLETGVVDRRGNRRKICVIAVKGDWPYLIKSGRLARHFSTGAKRGVERRAPKGKCHLCQAGCRGFPYEDLGNLRAAWRSTIGLTVPWETTPPFLQIGLPHDASHPGSYYQPDIWHTVHLGIGKAWVCSVIALAMHFNLVPGNNIEARFEILSQLYRSFCRESRLQPIVTKLTPKLLSYNEPTPTGAWHKGGLTTNLFKFVERWLGGLKPEESSLIERALRGTRQMNQLFTLLFRAPFFISQDECRQVFSLGHSWVCEYRKLAEECFARQLNLFPLFPKLHGFEEIMEQVRLSGEFCHFGINCLALACQQDEDQIGKTARLSRRVSARRTIHRTFERYLTQCFTAWVRSGLLCNR